MKSWLLSTWAFFNNFYVSFEKSSDLSFFNMFFNQYNISKNNDSFLSLNYINSYTIYFYTF